MAQFTNHNPQQSHRLNKGESFVVNLLLGALLLSFIKGSSKASTDSEASFAPDNGGTASNIPNGSATNFLSQYKALADYTEQFYLIPSIVTLAQGGLESGWGSSKIAKDANNLFGIRADSGWSGAVIHTTNGDFRKYDNIKDSFIDHAKFLTTNSRYAPAFNSSDPYDFAQSLADAEYGGKDTQKYANTLKSVMQSVDSILTK